MKRELGLSILPYLKNNDNVFFVIKESCFDPRVIEAGVPLLHLQDKADDVILYLLKESNHHLFFCKTVVPYLKDEGNIISLLTQLIPTSVANKSYDLYRNGMPLLSIHSIAGLLRISDYEANICSIGVPFLIEKRAPEDFLFDVVQESVYNYIVCMETLPFLCSEDKILAIMKESEYDDNVSTVAQKRLKELSEK